MRFDLLPRRVSRGCVGALLTLLLVACAGRPVRSPTVVEAPAAAPLRVASWNMEHLAEADGVGCRPRQEPDYARMRQYVAQLDADVVAFAEVESASAAARVFPPEQYTVLISERPRSGRGGDCRGQPGLHIRHQDVGFAVRKGLLIERHPDVTALALGDPDLRWGVDISVRDRAGRPLRLLALHLKSGCFEQSEPTPSCQTLFKQTEVLKAWISAREREPALPYLILGDWNRRLGNSGDRVWRALQHSTAAGVRLRDVPGGRRPACSSYDAYIDHIVLGPMAAREYRDDSFIEHTYERSGQPEHLSDHCAVSVDLGGGAE